MIIFGSSLRHKVLAEGEFFCPNCKTRRAYKHKRASRFFSVYFIPVVPIGKAGEYVECQGCGLKFETAVLEIDGPARAHILQDERELAKQINSLPERLRAGTPIEYALRDLTAAGLDVDVAQKMLDTYAGQNCKSCTTCGLTYVHNVDVCSECGGSL
ncbi:MAG: zinc-ribbon domain-containing protein [Chloroflexi bacterium]|nr:zinc-ribbon domain-containing protein [Chloroflexota bacterium]